RARSCGSVVSFTRFTGRARCVCVLVSAALLCHLLVSRVVLVARACSFVLLCLCHLLDSRVVLVACACSFRRLFCVIYSIHASCSLRVRARSCCPLLSFSRFTRRARADGCW